MRRPETQSQGVAAAEPADDLERLLRAESAAPRANPPVVHPSVTVGTVVGMRDGGRTPIVTHSGLPDEPVTARTTIDLTGNDVGASVTLAFEHGDPRRPIILGRLRGVTDAADLSDCAEVTSDGERLVVTAERGLVLRCGKASITLSADGRIVVKGTQIVSHATGLNRVRGGAIQLN